MRLVNDVSGVVEWVTVAYVPIVRKLQEPGADERARIRRCGILQRVIYAAFTHVIGRSHIGFHVKANGQEALAFPGVLLYICDQPEERAVLGLKGGQCTYSCTTCMAKIDLIGAPQVVGAEDRNVINTLSNQVEAYEHTRRQRQRQRRVALITMDSTSGGVPGLAGVAGLGKAPTLLYKMIGFDVLHVRFPSFFACVHEWSGGCSTQLHLPTVYPFSSQAPSNALHCSPPVETKFLLTFAFQVLDLGVTRMLVHRLVRVFPYLCKGKKPPAGSGTATPRCVSAAAELGSPQQSLPNTTRLRRGALPCRTPCSCNNFWCP